MIIDCIKCNKKFDVDSSLIPDEGRLLECSSCNNKWFFKKNIAKKTGIFIEKNTTIKDNVNTNIEIASDTSRFQDNQKFRDFGASEQVVNDKNLKKNKKSKKFNILYLTIVFIISFIALIIILDTFKSPLEKIFPNIEFLLYNLYESIKDIELFFKDLT